MRTLKSLQKLTLTPTQKADKLAHTLLSNQITLIAQNRRPLSCFKAFKAIEPLKPFRPLYYKIRTSPEFKATVWLSK